MPRGHRRVLVAGTWTLVLAAAVTSACQGFLDSNTPAVLDANALATRRGVEGTLVAAYRSLDCSSSSQSWGCAASNWGWSSITSGDAYRGSNAGDYSPFTAVELYQWDAEDVEYALDQKWRQVYEGVTRANATLRLLVQVLREKPGEIPDAAAAGIRGEALFLRAHYHFEAFRMWGNIPYYREDDTDFRKPNEDTTAVVADLLKDLDSAIKLLPDGPRNGQKGRATVWTAKAYKGRVQMYDHQFAAARTTFEDIVNNGPYALETSFDRVW